jgi:hypothetical protein
MKVTLEIDLTNYSDIVFRLILSKAEEWGVSPADAATRLLDEIAHRSSENRLNYTSTIDESKLSNSPDLSDSCSWVASDGALQGADALRAGADALTTALPSTLTAALNGAVCMGAIKANMVEPRQATHFQLANIEQA